MNKTVTINISGVIFHIEEDAYNGLAGYLAAIKQRFASTTGGAEILADIESRIAELLQEKLAGRQVIVQADVDAVQAVMGQPEEFGDEAPGMQSPPPGERIRRRLFRNPDEKIIGGVCSGLAAYFDIDTVWVRLAMFVLVFFGGLSIWVYLIMWLVIPEARTMTDKLSMRGESANINSIFRSFQDEARDVKSRMNRYGRDFNQAYGERVRGNISGALGTFFSILGRFIGFVMVILGALLLLGYATSLLAISVMDSDNDLASWKTVLFASRGHYALAVLSLIVVVGIPLFMLLYVGIRLLFRIRYSNRWLNRGLGGVWLLGLIVGIYVTMATLRQFSQASTIRQAYKLGGAGDTLVVKMRPSSASLRMPSPEHDAVIGDLSMHHAGYRFSGDEEHPAIIGFASLDIVESNSDSAEVIVTYEARGYNRQDANSNARAIHYQVEQHDSLLLVDEIFSTPEGTRFRTQEVRVKVMLPHGMVIRLDRSLEYMLDDVANVSDTWDREMVGRRWIMTHNGLRCIDCENLRTGHHHLVPPPEPPLPPGVHHRSRKTLHIGDDGVHVRDEDGSLDIDDNGIHVSKRGSRDS